ncbi:MAG: DUF2384 domain-containing protein [Myxococcales bacterium]|nr:DUF2384 domain-containing protein [Myxococcales bacterium]
MSSTATLDESPTLARRIFGLRTIASEPGRTRQAVHKGLTGAKVRALQRQLGVNQKTLASLVGVAPRTLQSLEGRKRLSAVATDRAARLVRVFDYAVEVLGDKDAASGWLLDVNQALGGEAPITWLGTDAGTLEVVDLLGRIDHGMW